MNHIRTFENYTTNPNLIIEDLGDSYRANKMEIEGAMYLYFKEKQEVTPGDNPYELTINYQYESWDGNNTEDIENALNYLQNLPGVETVIHRMGVKFELTFNKPIKIY